MEDIVNIPAAIEDAMSIIQAVQVTAVTGIPHPVTDIAADVTDTGIIRTAAAVPVDSSLLRAVPYQRDGSLLSTVSSLDSLSAVCRSATKAAESG